MKGRRWRVKLPFSTPLSLNDRDHWLIKAQKVRDVRTGAGWVIRAAKIPKLAHLSASIEYAPRDARRRDPINLVATLKACEDALVDVGVVPDDNPRYVESIMPTILAKTGHRGHLWLVVVETDLVDAGCGSPG